jgi:putative ABC transport system permease protein
MSIDRVDWKAEVRRRIRSTPLGGEQETGIVEEIAQDLEARHDSLLRQGIDDLAARQQVLAGLDVDPGLDRNLRRLARWPFVMDLEAGRGSFSESLLQDGRFAIRAFARRPFFTTVAVLAIAIGVAAVTTVFSLVKAVTFRPLPAAHFGRVVVVWQQDPTTNRDRLTLSPLEFREYGQATSFASVAAMRGVQLSVGTEASPIAVSGLQVSPELFTTFGITPVLGRGFSPSPDAAGTEVVITSEFWRTHLGADPAVIGKELRLQVGSGRFGFTVDAEGARSIDGTRVIVGVLPEGMARPWPFLSDIWLPLPQEPSGRGLVVFARLAPAATLAGARAETATIARVLQAQFPERSRNVESRVLTLREEVVGDVTPTLVLLSAAVLLLGLIVCANVGNMLLSRLAERQRELTVRRALGVTQRRLVQQLLTESVVLGTIGGVVGLVLAYWMTQGLAAAGPATIPRIDQVRLDASALTVAGLAAVAMSIAFGLLPALRIARARGNLLAQRSGNTADSARLREGLMIAEFALAFVVLVGAGLVFVSARALETTPVGYDTDASLAFRVSLPLTSYSRPEQRAAFFETLLDQLRALPGVTHAGAVSSLPGTPERSVVFDLDSAAPGAMMERPSARFRIATPGYFESLGIRVLRGRTFRRSDFAFGAVAVSRSMAERFWPGADPIGRQVRLVLPEGVSPWLTVVGVVEDIRQWIDTSPYPILYWANAQQAEYGLALRTTGDPSALSTAATRVVRDLDPLLPLFDVHTLRERLDGSQELTYARFRTAIMGAFGVTALLLASLGIYGVVRYSVAQRTQEFGIRIALGASPAQVFGMVLRQSLRATVIGGTIGVFGSIAVGRFLASVLYGGVAAQPLVMIGAAALLAGLSVLAAAGPARQASRVDPLIALRSE